VLFDVLHAGHKSVNRALLALGGTMHVFQEANQVIIELNQLGDFVSAGVAAFAVADVRLNVLNAVLRVADGPGDVGLLGASVFGLFIRGKRASVPFGLQGVSTLLTGCFILRGVDALLWHLRGRVEAFLRIGGAAGFFRELFHFHGAVGQAGRLGFVVGLFRSGGGKGCFGVTVLDVRLSQSALGLLQFFIQPGLIFDKVGLAESDIALRVGPSDLLLRRAGRALGVGLGFDKRGAGLVSVRFLAVHLVLSLRFGGSQFHAPLRALGGIVIGLGGSAFVRGASSITSLFGNLPSGLVAFLLFLGIALAAPGPLFFQVGLRIGDLSREFATLDARLSQAVFGGGQSVKGRGLGVDQGGVIRQLNSEDVFDFTSAGQVAMEIPQRVGDAYRCLAKILVERLVKLQRRLDGRDRFLADFGEMLLQRFEAFRQGEYGGGGSA
jgi:hypothetical protein